MGIPAKRRSHGHHLTLEVSSKTLLWEAMSEVEWAYVAGFVDGEGFIGIVRDNRNSGYFYRVRMEAGNTSKDIARWLEYKFKRKAVLRDRKNKAHKPMYQWGLTDKLALNFLNQILPYLIIKRRQAELAIKFQSLRVIEAPRINREEQEEIYWQMRKLNKKGR